MKVLTDTCLVSSKTIRVADPWVPTRMSVTTASAALTGVEIVNPRVSEKTANTQRRTLKTHHIWCNTSINSLDIRSITATGDLQPISRPAPRLFRHASPDAETRRLSNQNPTVMLTPWLSGVSRSCIHDNPWPVGCRFCRSELGSPCAGTRFPGLAKGCFRAYIRNV